MKSARFWQLASLCCGGALVFASMPGCSALFNLDADQCQVDSDCSRLGSELTCESGVCVDGGDSDGGGGTGGSAGASSSGDAGEAGGSTVEPDCTTNGECIDANFGQPYLCLAGQCLALTTDECPLVIGAENLRAPAPIVFGAYTLAPDAVSRSVAARNIDLVVSDFDMKVTGLRGGPNGSRRTLAFVVCNSQFPDVAPGTIDAFEPSLRHLIDDLRVPGIISSLSARDLQAVFSQRLDAAGTFVISPYDQDSELAAFSDGGRLWHMLGATSDLAPAFGALLKRTEKYLVSDENAFLDIPEGAKLRVAVVTANIARETDLRDALVALPEMESFEVESFQVDSALLTESPDVSGVADDLLDYAPHIIVALAGSEFIQGVFPVLESGNNWSNRTGGNQQLPMYVLGSAMAPETWSVYSAKQSDGGGFATLLDRIVGVAYASAEDTSLRDKYESRLLSVNKDLVDPTVLLGSESVYDATYLMIYAAAAAGEVPALDGRELALGMRRLLAGAPYDVGPSPIPTILNALDNGEDIGLNLTLGEPNWNTARGTRNGIGSVYCLNNGAFAYEGTFPRGPNLDALRYDPATGELEDKPLPCIPKF